MASIVGKEVEKLVLGLGRGTLHSLYPDDFEYYMMALELVNSKGEIIQYFAFPVMPDSLHINEPQILNINKSAGGVTIMNTPSFTPKEIQLQGSFGRKLKILLGADIAPLALSTIKEKGINKVKQIIKKAVFNVKVKTGYGCIKLLQEMCHDSKELDENGLPYRLYLYNMAFGESWWVKVTDLSFIQDKSSSNMIWNYNLSLKTIGPVEHTGITKITSLLTQTAFNQLQKRSQKILSGAFSQIKNVLSSSRRIALTSELYIKYEKVLSTLIQNTLGQFPTTEKFFSDFYKFNKFQVSTIINYAAGGSSTIPYQAITQLKQLQKDTQIQIENLINSSTQVQTAETWESLILLEELKNNLETVANSSKWQKSPLINGIPSLQVERDFILSQNQTLENISNRIIGDDDKENDWYNIALRNDLIEEDYTSEGGNQIQISSGTIDPIIVNSVIDNLSGEKVYGLDLDKKLIFENDDLKVLDYKETINQTVSILANLHQKDNPEFEEDGIQTSIIIGTNLNSIAYPSLIRQMGQTFSKDDTLKNFKIINIRREQDNLFIDFEVKTRLDETINQTMVI